MVEKKEAAFNIFKHNLVPKYTKLKPEELDGLFQQYNILPKQLPKLSMKDPVAKELELQPGDVVKIISKSQTVKERVFYRVVISG